MEFSYDYSYMSCLDSCFGIYSIFKVDTLKDSQDFREIYSGTALDLKWCPYENIYACTQKGQVNFKEPPVIEIKKDSNLFFFLANNSVHTNNSLSVNPIKVFALSYDL